MIKKRYLSSLKYLFIVIAAFFWVNAFAGVQDPQVMLKATVEQLQHKVSAEKDTLESHPQKLYDLVDKTILPVVDVNRMAGLTLGGLWRKATTEQRQAFVKQFTMLLTRTYAKALLTVSEYSIEIHPPRSTEWAKKKYLSINGVVKPENGAAPSRVTYYLVREGQGWKIYDFAVEGVSFVKNFRSQFQNYPDMKALLLKITELNDKAHVKS